jgi:hypothetical protein
MFAFYCFIIKILSGEVEMRKIKVMNIAYIITVVIVFSLVMTAVLTNLDKFLSKETIKYTQVNIENGIMIDDLITEYSTLENKATFIAEVKKINKLDDVEHINKKSLIIPLIKSE